MYIFIFFGNFLIFFDNGIKFYNGFVNNFLILAYGGIFNQMFNECGYDGF